VQTKNASKLHCCSIISYRGGLFWFNVDQHTNANLTSSCHGVQEYEPYTCNGSVDIKGNPASKKHTGKWRACYSILGNQTLVPIFCLQSAMRPTFVTSSCILVLKILPLPFLSLIFFSVNTCSWKVVNFVVLWPTMVLGRTWSVT
jgi:hypothetical protein